METGRVSTRENGELLHPANVTRRFIELYEEIGLPPVRLHDLRHAAATLAPAAGAGLKAAREMLGHSSIAVTADTYTSPPSEADLAIAEATARLVPRAPGTPACRPAGSCRFLGGNTGTCHAVRSRPAHANGPGRGVRGRAGHRPGQKPQVSDAWRRAPCRVRTDDPRFTRAVLWPAELRRQRVQCNQRRTGTVGNLVAVRLLTDPGSAGSVAWSSSRWTRPQSFLYSDRPARSCR